MNQKQEVTRLETNGNPCMQLEGLTVEKWGENAARSSWPQGGDDTTTGWANVTLGWKKNHDGSY